MSKQNVYYNIYNYFSVVMSSSVKVALYFSLTQSVHIFSYGLRFLGYFLLTNPWFVLFLEPLHGITFGLMYAAASSYASSITPPGMHGTIQGLIGGIHFGTGML